MNGQKIHEDQCLNTGIVQQLERRRSSQGHSKNGQKGGKQCYPDVWKPSEECVSRRKE